MTDRYQVGLEPKHYCCYHAEVVDEKMRWGGKNGDEYPITICECAMVEDAVLIARLLNEHALEEA